MNQNREYRQTKRHGKPIRCACCGVLLLTMQEEKVFNFMRKDRYKRYTAKDICSLLQIGDSNAYLHLNNLVKKGYLDKTTSEKDNKVKFYEIDQNLLDM